MILVLAAAVAVAAFLVLRPEDEGDAPEPAQTGTPRATPAVPPQETTTPEARAPEPPTIRIRGGEPVGGVETIEAERGDTVRFQVASDAVHEVHLHGYDVFERVAPRRPAEFRVKADETGVFEIELEGSHTQIAELKVEP